MEKKNNYYAIASYVFYNYGTIGKFNFSSKKGKEETLERLMNEKELYNFHDSLEYYTIDEKDNSVLLRDIIIDLTLYMSIIDLIVTNKFHKVIFERCIFSDKMNFGDLLNLLEIKFNNCIFFKCFNMEFHNINFKLNVINISKCLFTNGLYINGFKKCISSITLSELMFTKSYNQKNIVKNAKIKIKDVYVKNFIFTTYQKHQVTNNMYKNADLELVGNKIEELKISQCSQILICKCFKNIIGNAFIDISKSNCDLSFDNDIISAPEEMQIVISNKYNKISFSKVYINNLIRLLENNTEKESILGNFYENINELNICGPGYVVGINYIDYLKKYYKENKKNYKLINETIYNMSIILEQFTRGCSKEYKNSNYSLRDKINCLYNKYLFNMELKNFIINKDRTRYNLFGLILEFIEQLIYRISKYGTSGISVLFFSFIIILLFSFVYFLCQECVGYFDCWNYSSMCFVAMGFFIDDCRMPVLCQYIGIFEAFLGVPLLGYFISVETGKITVRNK